MFAHLSGKSCDWGFISAISIQLSASGQHEKTKEMYNKVVEDVIVEQLPEESEEDLRVRTFTELFRKLPFPDQNHFLSTIIKKFKRERQIGELVSWFSTQLDASDQQELIGELVHVKADDETITNEDLVQRTKLLWPVAADEQLCDGVIGVIIEKLEDESEADFKLRRFTELCKKVVDFGVQVQFLDSVVQKLLEPRRCLPHGVLLQPQDSASAAELLWQLSSFGFSLLSIDDQQDKIKQISNKISAEAVKRQRLAGESEEDLRQKTFTMLFNKAPVSTRVNLFEELTDKFFGERRLCESILLFRQHGSNDQQEKIEEMFGDSGRLESKDAKNVILEKLDEESEEDFRLRRFIKLCSTDTCLLDVFMSEEDEKRNSKGLQLQKSGYEEIDKIKQFRYAEFYIGLSVIWFKTRCAKHPGNPVEVLVSNVGEGDHDVEKLQHETEEDFRLRRFTESFKQLEFGSHEYIVDYIKSTFGSQEYIVDNIKSTIVHDLGYHNDEPRFKLLSGPSLGLTSDDDERPPFSLEFSMVKSPNLRGGGVATTQGGGGGGAITQGGGDGAITQGGQGTSQQ
ncbi:hypothetical protein TB1_026529 [Malus domestica]|uniref:uncharacterized protein n=1 Tax=Malus domestica TaxID=3750 RepID=UPI0010A9A9BC|nr:uncharacterized protein LOC103401768 [Malus domestica]